ncbi:MAG: hypothetical protein Q4D29_00995 [Lachnospiraceae bacterium]|nr:hypothetical protein [Lachnospiraceae bacterium]
MKWEKRGLIFEPNKRFEWMQTHAQIPFPLEFDDFIRIYFATRGKYVNKMCESYGAFIDVDKTDFSKIIRISEKPIMQHGGIGEFDEFGTMPASVIRVDKKYYMYYCGWTRSVSTPHKESIGLAVSDDGEYFVKYAPGPLMGDTLYEPYLHSYPVTYNINGKYHMFYHTGIRWIQGEDRMETQYLLRHAVSEDGIKWDFDYKNIIETKVEYESQTSPTIFYKDGVYHMYFCYRYSLNFRDVSERGYRIGYAFSEDLFNWKRADELAGIDVSSNGWDSKMIAYPCVKKINDRYYMFYCGNDFGKQGFGYSVLVEE